MTTKHNGLQNKELVEFLEQVDPDWKFFFWQLDRQLNEIQIGIESDVS